MEDETSGCSLALLSSAGVGSGDSKPHRVDRSLPIADRPALLETPRMPSILSSLLLSALAPEAWAAILLKCDYCTSDLPRSFIFLLDLLCG